MENTSSNIGLTGVAAALHAYLHQVESDRALCMKCNATAAIHTRGKALQLYRVFEVVDGIVPEVKRATEKLHDWSVLPEAKQEQPLWNDELKEVAMRTKKHKSQHELITSGIEWEGRPVIAHAYKFEPDSVWKMELVVPSSYQEKQLPVSYIASLLRLHEYLVPEFLSKPLAPYVHHEAQFDAITEYLSREMPKDLYTSKCFPQLRTDPG